MTTAQKTRTRCEVWTRVMGYHRPVSHFNIGKKAEHYARKHFEECRIANQEFIQQYQGPLCVSPASSNSPRSIIPGA